MVETMVKIQGSPLIVLRYKLCNKTQQHTTKVVGGNCEEQFLKSNIGKKQTKKC